MPHSNFTGPGAGEPDLAFFDSGLTMQISWKQFDRLYRERRPVIIVENRNHDLRKRATRQALLREFGDVIVTLSTANTISHEKTSVRFR